MKSTVIKRSVVINGHKTSVSVEDQFWAALKEIAAERQVSLSELIAVVAHDRGEVGNLSSALRCLVLARYYTPAASTASARSAPWHPQPQPSTP